MIALHNIKQSDLVYWVERENNHYEVKSGYYLGTYSINNSHRNIVSLGSVTSCVVRHLYDEEVLSEDAAIKLAYEKNKAEDIG